MKIVAVLLNPTIDQIYEIKNFQAGGTFKVGKSIIYPVGKAISFALGIRELSKEVDLKVIAFIGQEDKEIYSDFLIRKKIDFEFVLVKGKTRSNKTINDPVHNTTTHIRETGFNIEESDLKKLTNILKKDIKDNDFLVFSGSIPLNIDKTIYFNLINIGKERRAVCILDTNGPPLISGINAYPRIIKPNLVELSQILNNPKLVEIDLSNITDTCNKIVKTSRSMLKKDLEILLITLGDKGAILLTKDSAVYGNVDIDKVVDTVGSGDSFLAGFVLNYFFKKELRECLMYAIACGAANTLIPGPGIFKIEDVKKLIKKVEIIDLS